MPRLKYGAFCVLEVLAPAAELTVIQELPSLAPDNTLDVAVQFKAPGPPFRTTTPWVKGTPPPATTVNFRADEDRTRVCCDELIVMLTGTVTLCPESLVIFNVDW